jgi:hypothetical protein
MLADGMRLILQHDAFLNDFTILSATETDPAALARMAPDILILDPWQSLLLSETMPENFALIFPVTSLIGYCQRIDAAQARSLMLAGFRGLIPKTLQSNDLARIVIAVVWNLDMSGSSRRPVSASVTAMRHRRRRRPGPGRHQCRPLAHRRNGLDA